MTCMFIGDTLYMFADIDADPRARPAARPALRARLPGRGAMALHPSMRALTEPAPAAAHVGGGPDPASSPWPCSSRPSSTLAAPREPIGPSRRCSIIIVLTGAAVLRIVQALRTAERSEARLAHQAMHDSLTGLPNRRMMHEHLTRRAAPAARSTTPTWRCCSSTSTASSWSTTPWATRHGDELLIEVGRRLQDHVRPTDLVTRIGGRRVHDRARRAWSA